MIAAMWRSCISGPPQALAPCKIGWELDSDGIKLRPFVLPILVKTAPEEVLKVSRCRCLVSHCKTNLCRRFNVNLKCANFCEYNETMCENRNQKVALSNDSDCDSADDSE